MASNMKVMVRRKNILDKPTEDRREAINMMKVKMNYPKR
jgi:hypothetical protein